MMKTSRSKHRYLYPNFQFLLPVVQSTTDMPGQLVRIIRDLFDIQPKTSCIDNPRRSLLEHRLREDCFHNPTKMNPSCCSCCVGAYSCMVRTRSTTIHLLDLDHHSCHHCLHHHLPTIQNALMQTTIYPPRISLIRFLPHCFVFQRLSMHAALTAWTHGSGWTRRTTARLRMG